MKALNILTGAVIAIMIFTVDAGAVLSAQKAEETGRLVAAMLVSGRGIVARNQGLINDPAKGDKGFTAEYVEEGMIEGFEKSTGGKIADLDAEIQKTLQLVLDAAKQAVTINQSRINMKGVAFKGFIPAVFGRITGEILNNRTGIALKQTTLKPRNTYNKPDTFEEDILKQFESGTIPKGEGYGKMTGNRYRYMYPIYIKKGCLKCHGDPKGELDIAGKKKEGYKVGDLRGAISVNFEVR